MRGFYMQGDKEIHIVPSIFDAIMESANLKPLDIKRCFKDKGITSCEGRNLTNRRAHIFDPGEESEDGRRTLPEKINASYICIIVAKMEAELDKFYESGPDLIIEEENTVSTPSPLELAIATSK
jgi:hypothetical protein